MIAHAWTHVLEGLPLVVATPAGWTGVVRRDLGALLADHAHCEQKAASTAMALIGRFPHHPGLARGMMTLAQEELHHFRQVLDRIESRGETLTPPLPDRYVGSLREWGFRHRGGLGPLGDLLLVSAFVEARSCERFRLLTESFSTDPGPDTADLGLFYARLADAEGRHWELFRDLALTTAPPGAVERRLAEMAQAEGAIVASRPLEARMH